ncbi:proton-coupled amino acid transporter-like protein pathetic [Rhagoletis pomonella]|uniref:proton-coupled amino acid transporter-like protein pathetic n=1 Tax=Rhagoletis pomonella TaxID=28610 RepID=UPI00177EEA7F|nr:proton-coupled amino acid transporter-like protein pathetic [Rhagoletis pomonella]
MVNIADSGGKHAPQEMEQFLPGDGTTKYKIQPRKDVEQALPSPDFDPFAERKVEHPTTDNETLTHLLKASLGTGILSMPIAFMYSGIVLGIFATIFTAFICTHCSYVLVKCAHKLYYKSRRTQMSFAEVAEVSFQNGPKWARGFAPVAKFSILFGLFLTYFGTCSVYTVIVAKNFEQVNAMSLHLC